MDRPREWIRARPILVLSIGLIIAFVIGGAVGQSGKSGLEDDKASLETEVATAQRAQQSAEADVDRTAANLERAESRLAEYSPARVKEIEAEGRQIVKEAKGEAESILAPIGRQAAAKEAQLEQVKSELNGAEEEQELSYIPGDGTYKVGTDFLAGTYRAPGGGNCYWATLNSADPYDIASNENGSGPQIATIESPYFQTEGCGEWERIE